MNSSKSKIGTFILGWGAALILFFPILWMLLTGFKTEAEAIATPPTLFFSPTLENYHAVFERADYMSFAINSVVISVVATALAILIAVPAAYAMAFFPTERTKGTLLWMRNCSTHPHDRKHVIQNSFPKRHAAVQRQYLDRGSSWH